ncbi:MAG: peptidylprolyl isomerase [Panacibacter sp.]
MKPLLLFLLLSSTGNILNAQQLPDTVNILKLKAPETFKANFHTSQGDFVIEVYREWSPLAADRLYQLLKTNYYNNNIAFRATPKYVQFGITDFKSLNFFWDRHNIPDEPVLQSNLDGTVSFATGGANNRSAQIFINMQNNQRLDTLGFNGVKGFPPVGKVISGMEALRKFNTQYGDDIAYKHQDSVYRKGNAYLIKNFPGLDTIITATIVE